jgi:hypothetical protein
VAPNQARSFTYAARSVKGAESGPQCNEVVTSANGMVRPCSYPASAKLARGTQTRSTPCLQQQHRRSA